MYTQKWQKSAEVRQDSVSYVFFSACKASRQDSAELGRTCRLRRLRSAELADCSLQSTTPIDNSDNGRTNSSLSSVCNRLLRQAPTDNSDDGRTQFDNSDYYGRINSTNSNNGPTDRL